MKEWANEYGDIFSLKIGSGTMIVLSSAEHVSEYVHCSPGARHTTLIKPTGCLITEALSTRVAQPRT